MPKKNNLPVLFSEDCPPFYFWRVSSMLWALFPLKRIWRILKICFHKFKQKPFLMDIVIFLVIKQYAPVEKE